MRSRFSITSFVLGLLALATVAYALPLFYTSYATYSALESSLRHGTEPEQVIAALGTTIGIGLLFVLVVLTAIFFVTTVLLLRLVIAPIKKLEQGFKALGEGNLDVSLDPEGLAEIQRISQGFNAATRRVREQTEMVASARADLEAANAKLQEEYVQAKKLNDLTVGRELTMIKMKEELARLKEQDGTKAE